MSLTAKLFSFEGRIGRASFWLCNLLLVLLMAVAIVLLAPGNSSETVPYGKLSGPIVILLLLCAWPSLAIGVKRLHDHNVPGWWLAFSFIPYIGSLWALVYLGLMKGTDGANDYGGDPLSSDLDGSVPVSTGSPGMKICPACHNRAAIELDECPWCEQKFPTPSGSTQSARRPNTSASQPLHKQETSMTTTATPVTQMTQSAEQESESNRRRADGRQLPYQTLRILAKLYIVLAPLILGSMLLIGLVMLSGEAPLSTKLGTFVGMCLVGAMYFLIMKSVAQAIYLMFDVSANTNMIRELHDAMKTQAGNQAKLAASLRELSDWVKGGGQAKPVASS